MRRIRKLFRQQDLIWLRSLRFRKLDLAFCLYAAEIQHCVFVQTFVFVRVVAIFVRHDQLVSWLICDFARFGCFQPAQSAFLASTSEHAGNERCASGAVYRQLCFWT